MSGMSELEKRVDRLLDVIKGLKEERSLLKRELHALEKEVARRERDAHRWVEERKRLRIRVEQILSETGRFLQKPVSVSGARWKSRRRDWESGKGSDA